MNTQIPLSQLALGGQATIVRIGGERLLRRKMLTMGIITGERITLTARAPLGDPLEFQVKGYRLSLRSHEAAQVLVEVAQ